MASFLRSLFNRTPIPYAPARTGFSMPWSTPTGQVAQMRAMGSVGTLFAIVNRTSNATSQVNWRLYRKAASGKPEDRAEVTAHAALDLWNKPNPYYTRQEFIESFQQHIDLTGEGWWVIGRNPRSPLPLELWVARPDRMAPVPDAQDFIRGYVYTGPSGEQVPLEVKDVVFLRTPNPLDPYRGMGAVQTILADLDSTRYSAEWNRNFFINGAEPGGIVEVDKRLSDDEFDELKSRWEESHKGVANAHRVAILEQGKWVQTKFTQRDMQFAELRTQSSEFIREAFGFPKPLLGSVEDVNRANAEAAAVVFARWLVVPRLERIKQALNSELLPLYGPDAARTLEFDYDNPVPDDKQAEADELTAKAKAAKDLVDAGYNPQDVARVVGLPEMRTATAPATPAQPTAPGPGARLDIHHHALQAQHTPQPVSFFDMARAARPRRLRAQSADTDLEEVRADFESALAELMDRWDGIEDGWYDALEEQIAKAVDEGEMEQLGGLDVSADEATLVLRRALADMAQQAAGRMVEEAAAQGVKLTAPKVDPDLSARVAAGRLRNAFGSELFDVAAITAELLAHGVAAAAGREALRLATPGATGKAVGAAVVAALRSLKNWFRRDQLGGALHRAQNEGRIATLAEAPKATYLASEKNDGNTCDPCDDIDGTVFDDLPAVRAAYGTGGYIKCQGGIRCRGTVVARWE